MRRWALVAVTAISLGVLPIPSHAVEPLCSPAEASDIVRDFVATYNRGDVDYLDRIWAQEPDFFWYFDSADPARRTPVLSEDRTTLTHYFTQRAALGDQLHVRKLTIGWQRGWHGAWGFSFVVKRTTDQPEASGIYRGKGAVTCARNGQFMHAWSMGRA
jgi:hypothetical protein